VAVTVAVAVTMAVIGAGRSRGLDMALLGGMSMGLGRSGNGSRNTSRTPCGDGGAGGASTTGNGGAARHKVVRRSSGVGGDWSLVQLLLGDSGTDRSSGSRSRDDGRDDLRGLSSADYGSSDRRNGLCFKFSRLGLSLDDLVSGCSSLLSRLLGSVDVVGSLALARVLFLFMIKFKSIYFTKKKIFFFLFDTSTVPSLRKRKMSLWT